MQTLKYKVINSRKQYNEYCRKLEELVFGSHKNKEIQEEIRLLTVLIEKWDAEHDKFSKLNPIEILKSLMKEHEMKAVDLARLIDLSEGQVSEILHLTKGLSKKTIRILAEHFKLSQEAFNKDYPLKEKQVAVPEYKRNLHSGKDWRHIEGRHSSMRNQVHRSPSGKKTAHA